MSYRGLWLVLMAMLPASALHADRSTAERRWGNVTEARVLKDAISGSDWLVNGGRYSGEHFSPLKQITADNADELGLAWLTEIPSFAFAVEPIVVDGVIYVSGSLGRVFAVDATNGKMLWLFDPKIRLDMSIGNSYGSRTNRGVAVWEGRVYVGTGECTLIAIDATKGTKLWESQVCDPLEGVGAHVRSAPRVGGGKVFMGYSGSTSARGSLVAFDAKTGEESWRFWTVPGDPAKGFETPELERASATWTGGWSMMGGGSVWEAIRYDPVTGFVFFGTAAPGPGNPKQRGAGDALFANCIIAVDAMTGAYKWHYQTVPEDAYDYDAAPPLIVTDLNYSDQPGERRRVVMSAPKNGFFYVLDARTGDLVAADPVVDVTWASHVDMETGRPVRNPDTYYYADENEGKPVLVKPSPGGGHTWHPMSFSPATGLVYLPLTDLAANFVSFKPVAGERGVTRSSGWRFNFTPDLWLDEELPAGSGKLRAWDPVKRETRWVIDHDLPWNGGVLSTAGNLVFQGTSGGEIRSYRADTGKVVWSLKTGTPILSPPVSFELDNDQYILVSAGVGSGNGITISPYVSTDDAHGPSRLFAFKLGGKAKMPPLQDYRPVPRPPERTASREEVKRGAKIFDDLSCEYCHGKMAIGVGRKMFGPGGERQPGTIPDLRYLSPQAYTEWQAIVRGGSRKHLGMPAFHDSISVEEAEALRAYVVERAWNLYERSLAEN